MRMYESLGLLAAEHGGFEGGVAWVCRPGMTCW